MQRTKPMKKFAYTARIVEEDLEHIVLVDDLPEVLLSMGSEVSERETIRSLTLDAVKNAIQARIDYQDDVPTQASGQTPEGGFEVTLPPMVCAKIALYEEVRKRGMTKTSFAKAVGITPTDASRLLDVFHETRQDILLLAFRRLGVEIYTEVTVREIPSDSGIAKTRRLGD